MKATFTFDDYSQVSLFAAIACVAIIPRKMNIGPRSVTLDGLTPAEVVKLRRIRGNVLGLTWAELCSKLTTIETIARV